MKLTKKAFIAWCQAAPRKRATCADNCPLDAFLGTGASVGYTTYSVNDKQSRSLPKWAQEFVCAVDDYKKPWGMLTRADCLKILGVKP